MTIRALTCAMLLVLVAVLSGACADGEGGGSAAGGGGATTDGGVATTPATGGDYLDGGFAPVEAPVKGGILRMAIDENIDCWNGRSYYGSSWSVFAFMARGLYGYPNTVETPATDALQPDLAEDMPTISEDGRTVTVTLREGLTFPSGSPVTADDVKATFELMLDPTIQCATGGPPASGYYDVIEGAQEYMAAMRESQGEANVGISGIKAVDARTTEFTLTAADGSFPRALAMSWAFIVPASTPHELTATPPPYVGPYRVTDYVPDELMKVEREPGWDGNVAAGVPEGANENNIDGFELAIGVSGDAQFVQLRDNALDLSLDGSAPVGADIPAAAEDVTLRDRFYSTPDAAIDYGVFRTDRAPFDEVEARQAVNYAINRRAIVKILGGDLSRSPWSQILSKNLLADQPQTLYTYDPARAKRLLTTAGAPRAALTLAHLTTPPAPAVAAAVKRDLEAVGFRVALKALSASVFYGYLADPATDYDLAIAGWGEDYADAITYFRPLLSCGSGVNYGRWCDLTFDAKLQEINALPPGPERAGQYAQLSTDTAQNHAPLWTIAQRRKVSLISERLGNYSWGPGKQFYLATYYLKDDS